jgi:hypothetical protein
MTREEDLIRSTTAAIAATVRDVPPLRLRSGADVVIIGPGEPRRARNRRWRSRLAPVGAVVTVAAVAVALVIMARVAPNEHGASPVNSPPAGASASVPEHYMAVTPSGDLVAGDTKTGKTVATIDAPQGLVFDGVAGGADDQRFVVSAAPASPPLGSLGVAPPGTGSFLGRKLYLVRLTPGTTQPPRLTPMAVTPPVGVLAVALSQTGQKLAVASATSFSGAVSAYSVSIYSVTTGRLLRAWTSATNVFGDNSHLHGLTWVDGDRGIMFATNTLGPQVTSTSPETVRRLDVTLGGSDLAADSKVAWSTTGYCGSPLISGDGSTIVCVSTSRESASSSTMTATWLAFSVAAPTRGHPLYQVSMPYSALRNPPGGTTLWIDSAGKTALIEELIVNPGNGSTSVRQGIISNGHFTLSARITAGAPANFGPTLPGIAW